ncbi:META domain-containing protein [Flavobacterium sp. ZT3R18]|uniref:META domain-containing protein n=1 Tax=Flavobacterium sp. ZT3R18 TaxID=2594429 RepID=UPI00117A1A09|nr:META domain-containing protein [Flavobacterium sp. ZT3R18]TRX37250.1 META domain-containing protein [Flavobacterium sp. ZT3R18]
MKKLALLVVFIGMTLVSCTTTKSNMKTASLEGTWELNYITGPRIAFEGLYPGKKPTIKFDLVDNKFSGNNSCNQYFGAVMVDGNKINFKDAKMGMTMMACQGNGDSVYTSTLEKIESYTISEDGKTLSFMMGDVVMMRFEKK